ncbi:MAG TPA: zf-HC2 domain-containing protein [Terriglobales bacterium]|nr:zf-HC2 domain-containing protein [Terriglobales bacterium]
MQCNEFDALLTDALDGVLTGTALDRFQVHAGSCKVCGPLLAEAEAGRNWLKGLTEVEPPANLVANILASTTGVDTQRLRAPARAAQPQISWLDRVQASLSGFFQPIWITVRQPRFAMSFGMAFFALSVGLTVAGVKPADLRQISLRPAAIRHTYYNTQARVVRYFDNARAVYELQAALRGIKRNMAPAEPGRRQAQPEKPKDDKNDTTQQPEQKQERNYSQTEDQLILASAPLGPSVDDLPVVSVTTYRRFV